MPVVARQEFLFGARRDDVSALGQRAASGHSQMPPLRWKGNRLAPDQADLRQGKTIETRCL